MSIDYRAKNAHNHLLKALEWLIDMDPTNDSPEGALLMEVAAAVEEYEAIRYPIREPTPEEAAAFRREQEVTSSSASGNTPEPSTKR